MAEAEQRRRLRASPGETSVRLAELLHDPELDPVHRRELVFELWDDAACTEELTSDTAPLAEEKVEAARQSRERVEAFVARFMRPGSKDGYGSDELARLNAQRCSAEPFTPTRTRD
jgi:hypothetical protein